MDQNRYRYAEIPPETPDDDPRWARWVEAERLGFVQARSKDAFVDTFRRYARQVGQRTRAIELVEPGSAMPGPVATFASWDGVLNAVGRQVRVNLISDVTVRTTHRRRGLLRALMTRDLTEAKEAGLPLAALTASEATIYGRFGFGVATQGMRVTIDCQRFTLRQPVTGWCEVVETDVAEPVLTQVWEAVQATRSGCVSGMAFLPDFVLGRFDWESGEASSKIRLVVHYDDAGRPDGFASYQPESSDDGSVWVNTVLAATPEAELALWDLLAHMDLVKQLLTILPAESVLPWALLDSRAVIPSARPTDRLWLRVLDVPTALEGRGWEHDGSVVMDVVDPRGLAEGRFRVDVREGRATVEQTDGAADVLLDAETLASLYLGDVSAATLAAAGRVQGDASRLDALFAVAQRPWTPFGF